MLLPENRKYIIDFFTLTPDAPERLKKALAKWLKEMAEEEAELEAGHSPRKQ
jgi:hypothetical protein